MPFYGRTKRANSYARRGRVSRAVKAAKKNATNAAVKRVRKLARKPVRKNTVAIDVLARQVKSLQRSKIGMVQTIMESWKLPKNGVQDTQWLGARPSTTNVHLFCVNDITDDANVMRVTQGADHTASISYLPWLKYNGYNESNSTGTLSGDVTSVLPLTSTLQGLRDSCFWNQVVDNTVSKEAYLPLSTEFQIEFSAKMTSNYDTKCIRVDIVQQHGIPPKSVDSNLALPESAIGLQHMADSDMLLRNQYNKKYFHVLKTDFIYLNARGTDSSLRTASGVINDTDRKSVV